MDKKTKIVLSVTTVVVLVLAITSFAIRGNQSKQRNFTPPPFQANAQMGEVDNSGQYYGTFELPYNDGNKCSVGLEGLPAVDGGLIEINFSSDKENTVWVRIVATDNDGDIVFESGILKPGEYIHFLELKKPVSSGSELNAKIITFEPGTYYSMGSASATIKIK